MAEEVKFQMGFSIINKWEMLMSKCAIDTSRLIQSNNNIDKYFGRNETFRAPPSQVRYIYPLGVGGPQ